MNRVDQSQGSKLSQTDRQTDRQTDSPLVEGPHPKDVDLENPKLHEMFPKNIETHNMETRKQDIYKVEHAKTEDTKTLP